jgi:cell division protein FtsN
LSTRYFELILSGRQLALVAVGVAVFVVMGFVLGVAVGVEESGALIPRPTPAQLAVVVATPVPTPVPTEMAPPSPAPPPVLGQAMKVPEAAVLPTAAAQPPPATPTAVATVGAAELLAATPPAAAPRSSATPRGGVYWVQVAAVSRRDVAGKVRQRVVGLGFETEQVVIRAAEGKYRVRLGPFPDASSAARVVARLRAQGFADAFAVSE